MEFQTEWKHEKVPSNPGDEYLKQYIIEIDKKGKEFLKEIEPINIYNKIQEDAKGTDTYEIIEKFMQTGDESLLNERKGFFGNFINVPNNPVDILKMVTQAENVFEQLDKDVRAEFENDVGVFKQSILDKTFEDRIAPFIGEKTKAEKAEELKAKVENKSEVTKSE